jgi:uncharacterized protein YfkK (UPF0435 family)
MITPESHSERSILHELQAIAEQLDRIERHQKHMAGSISDLDTVLENVSGSVSKLGTDLQQVFEFIKSHPNVDVSAQIAKGKAIADALAAVDAAALAEEEPIPVPVPTP